MLRFRWTFLGVLVVGVVAVDLLLLAWGYATHFRGFSSENGLLENVQLVCMVATTLVFARLIFRLTHAARLVASGAAALSLLFFFREFDTPINNAALEFLSQDLFLFLLSAVLAVLIVIQFYLNWAHLPAFLAWLIRIEWWPFLLAGILMIGADVFEKWHGEVVEEMLELNAHVVLVITAAAVWYATGRKVRAAGHAPAWPSIAR